MWYHSYDVFEEKAITTFEEYEIEGKVPIDFGKRLLKCTVEGKKTDDEFRNDFSYYPFTEQIQKLNLNPGYSRVLIELAPGNYWSYYDQFQHEKANLTSLSSTADLEHEVEEEKT